MNRRHRKKQIRFVLLVFAVFLISFYLLQRFWAHRNKQFVPDYPRVTLTADTDHETIFLQTGLGRAAVDTLLESGKFSTVLAAQDAFFDPPEAICTPLLGWFTREDRLKTSGTPLVDLQPGDIVLTLSTHTAGWRHGHAGLAIDENTTLECVVLGTNSALVNASHWSTYSNYAVLRLKGITPELQQKVAAYSLDTLHNIPYRLLSGFIGLKAADPESPGFGLHCSHLVWYAWNHFGYDLDSDDGKLVSSHDLLHSDLLEIVQLCGMDPRQFLSPNGKTC